MKNFKALSFLAALSILATAAGCGDKKTSSESEKAPETTAAAETTTEAATDAEADTDVPEIEGYDLLWNDEFNDGALDESKWNYEPHEPGWTNEELQEDTTSTDNVFLRDGKLVIKAVKSDKDGKDYYTSG